MSRMRVPVGLEDYHPPELLIRGKYRLRTTKGNDAGKSVALSVEVVSGPVQPDESDPQGRDFDCFVTANFDNFKDERFKQRMMDKKMLLMLHGR